MPTAAPPAPALHLASHDTAGIVALADKYLTPNYKNAPIVFVRGEGPWNIAEDGKRYLDFSAGVAVNALGHGHPDLVAALQAQVALLIHQSNYWHNAHAAPLAQDLCDRFEKATGGVKARAFFCNSGAEGTEATVKLARRYYAKTLGKPRPGIITMQGSFHGRTYAAMTATAQPKYQDGFEPLVPGFKYAKFGDLASIEALVDDQTGAVMLEVVQGEGGVCVPPTGFFRDLRKLCDDRGLLLLLDEVQTGLGRTGTFFAFEQEGIVPDILWLAKALGGGVPVGAMLAREPVAQALVAGCHATTFGANALATLAGRVTLAVMDRDGLVEHSRDVGAFLLQRLHQEFDGRPYTGDVRGRGLMVGVAVQGDPKAVVEAARARGLLVSVAGANVLRLTPPLIVDRDHCDFAARTLREAADAALAP
jgi:acetylornithine/N-succinyldiaminopimelate aminotransferase